MALERVVVWEQTSSKQLSPVSERIPQEVKQMVYKMRNYILYISNYFSHQLDEDPREALLKYAEIAEKEPMWVNNCKLCKGKTNEYRYGN